MDYNKDKYNENLSSGRERNPNSNGYFGDISTGPEQIPRHIHDGIDSPKINEANIIPNISLSGSITMTQGTITGTAPNQIITWANYYIPIASTVKEVKFYGGAVNKTVSPAIHAMIIGEARISIGYQYQPGTPNSVLTGNIKQNITQGSAAMIMTNGVGGTGAGAFSILRSSQSYIAYAADGSNPQNIYAVARVFSYSNTQIIVQTAFASGWSLSGQWIIN